MSLVFRSQNIAILNLGVTPNECVKGRHPPVSTESLKNNPRYFGNCAEIGCELLQVTVID